METKSFFFGVLITYGVLITTLIGLGLFKIINLIKGQSKLENDISNLKFEIELRENVIRRILEEVSKDITMVERTIMQRIDKEIDQTKRQFENEVNVIHKHEDELHREIEEIKTYADAKIDKVVMKGTFPTSRPKKKF